MPQEQNFALRQAHPPTSDERGLDDHEENVFNSNLTNSRDGDSVMRRALVLIGAALSQLPIWGGHENMGLLWRYSRI